MKKLFRVITFLLLVNVTLFGDVLGDLTSKLNKCESFKNEVLNTKSPQDYSLFEKLKGEIVETPDKSYLYPKNPSAEEAVRLYTNISEESAYLKLRGLAHDYNTVLTPSYKNIFNIKENLEQTIKLHPSLKDENAGFNCYIKKGHTEIWIASYPYGKRDKEEKKMIAVIQSSTDGTKMYFYKRNTSDE